MIKEQKANRKHKDSVFTKLFGEKKNLLELYNAISGKNYSPNTEIEIITLEDVLFMDQLNDIAFTIDDKFVVLIEHQSTINENMPLRMLMYISREYELITNSYNLYDDRLIKIPTPEFIVLYNGDRDMPDFMELKLSDAFAVKNDKFPLELVVKTYNINKGRNVELAKKSRTLSEYEEFIAQIKDNLKSMKLREAIKQAVKSCIKRNILLSFLKRYASEVENMLLTGWNTKDAMTFKYNRGKEDGRIEGRAEARNELFALLDEDTLREVKKKLKIS